MVRTTELAIAAIVFCCTLLAWNVALTVVIPLLNGGNVKTISGVAPNGGNVELLASTGVLITPDVAGHAIDVENTGVVTINGLASSDPARNIVIAVTTPGLSVSNSGHTVTLTNGGVTRALAGSGIGVSAAVGNVTFSNTGVLALSAGSGIVVNASTGVVAVSNGGVITINSLVPSAGNILVAAGSGITVDSAGNTVTISDSALLSLELADTDAASPTVTYAVAVGLTTAIPENTWRTGRAAGFTTAFFPGAVDSGYGDVGGTAWAVPAASYGLFHVSVSCELEPSAIATDDMQTASVALCLGATAENPYTAGVIPSGGYATISLSGGANSGTAPALPRQLSLSTTFQAGCSGCLVQGGDALTLHVRMDHTGTQPGPYTMQALCFITVAHVL